MHDVSGTRDPAWMDGNPLDWYQHDHDHADGDAGVAEIHEAARDLRVRLHEVPDHRIDLHTRGPLISLRLLKGLTPEHPMVKAALARTRQTVERAQLWWIAEDMVDVLSTAAPSMPSQTLIESDVPDPAGLVFMERPIVVDECVVQAITWQVYDGIVKHDGIEDHYGPAIEVRCFTNAEEMGWMESACLYWEFGATGDRPPLQCLAALWTLSGQSAISDSRPAVAGRHARRRCLRAGLPPEATSMRVVELRRQSSRDGGDGGSVDYSHRWIVSGHWRNQWMPSIETHRLQWIAPHVKGPDDKPLVVRETVKAWTR